ncbi:hypothetical protein CF65_02889 [Aggregatibacter actinomycetemcomitans HK1651]|nr:hypothetical protein CF65_02889 [Aggregatibacter actinomycetemcomitans HK1651]
MSGAFIQRNRVRTGFYFFLGHNLLEMKNKLALILPNPHKDSKTRRIAIT